MTRINYLRKYNMQEVNCKCQAIVVMYLPVEEVCGYRQAPRVSVDPRRLADDDSSPNGRLTEAAG